MNGGTLPIIHSSAEQTALVSILPQSSLIFIGFGNWTTSSLTHRPIWIDGSSIDYQNFVNGGTNTLGCYCQSTSVSGWFLCLCNTNVNTIVCQYKISGFCYYYLIICFIYLFVLIILLT